MLCPMMRTSGAHAGVSRCAIREVHVGRANCIVMRSSGIDNGTTSTSAPSTTEKEKVTATISSLDSLLGTVAPLPKEIPVKREAPAATTSSAPSPVAPSRPAAAASKAAPETFDSVMGFGGLAPEIINGRCAMLAFMAAISSELYDGQSVYVQLLSGGGSKALLVIMLVSLASFAPGVNKDNSWLSVFGKGKTPAEFGPFNANAEIINGRAAMMGLASIIFLEGTSSYAFFS